MGLTTGMVKRATYEYNGHGHRMGQNLTAGNADPQKNIHYTPDLTHQYQNLLQKSTDKGIQVNPLHSTQTYFLDGNVTGMEEEGKAHFYFQDDLGSPMRIADEMGRSEETYGFDEFGV